MSFTNVHVDIRVISVYVISFFDHVSIMLVSFVHVHIDIHVIIVKVVSLLICILLFAYMLLSCKCLVVWYDYLY